MSVSNIRCHDVPPHQDSGRSGVSLMCAMIGACVPPGESETAPSPRPVTVLEMSETRPVQALQLTGAVKAWKEQDVAFEVSGRVEWVVESTTNLDGRWQEGRTGIVEGGRVASMDRMTYQASERQARAEAEYARAHLEHVLPAMLAAAEARCQKQQSEHQRIAAIPEDTLQPIEEIAARADLDVALAQIECVQAELKGAEASLAEADAALTQSKLNLGKTTLHTPFAGEVSDVHVEAGGYVSVGVPETSQAALIRTIPTLTLL